MKIAENAIGNLISQKAASSKESKPTKIPSPNPNPVFARKRGDLNPDDYI